MTWRRADDAEIDPKRRYVVITNGGEYDDYPGCFIMQGRGVMKRLAPNVVYHRPAFLIEAPEEAEEHLDALSPKLDRRKRA